MRDRYAVWENETTHTFYIEALTNTVQPGKRLLYSGKEYLNFKNKDHADMLVNMLNGLVDEAGILEQRVHYWKIEAETDHGRWLRCLEEIERLRASSFVTAVPVEQYERVIKAGDMMYSWLGVCGRRNNSFGDDWLRAKKGAMLQAEQFALDMKNKGWTGWNAAKGGKQS